jgi:hypothetical protein
MPFYLWAIIAACTDRWLIAGCLIALGALLKGQEAVVIPVFLIWPLMGFRLGAMARWIIGFVLSAGIIVSPWIVPMRIVALLLIGMSLLIWPIVRLACNRKEKVRSLLTMRRLRWLMAVTFAATLWSVAWLLGGSFAWFKIGFVYGAEKFNTLEMGGASSLASIFQRRYHWQTDMPVGTLPMTHLPLTIGQLLIAIFALLLLLGCLAMRLAERRGDVHFLMAMAAPWIAYFAVFPKMHERYLLWGVIASCTAVAVGLGPTLLAIFFSLCSSIMSLYQILGDDNSNRFLTNISPTFGKNLQLFTRGTYPDIAWAILLAMLIWLYMSFHRQPRPIAPAQTNAAAEATSQKPRLHLSIFPVRMNRPSQTVRGR